MGQCSFLRTNSCVHVGKILPNMIVQSDSERGVSVMRDFKQYSVTRFIAFCGSKDITSDVDCRVAVNMQVCKQRRSRNDQIDDFTLNFSVGDVVSIDVSDESKMPCYGKIHQLFRIEKSREFCFSYYPVQFLDSKNSYYIINGPVMGVYAEGGNDVGIYSLSRGTSQKNMTRPRLYSIFRISHVIRNTKMDDTCVRKWPAPLVFLTKP